jgi:hypothetical protein
MDGHVERVPVIQPEARVERRLAERAYGQRATEARREEALDLGDLAERPGRREPRES